MSEIIPWVSLGVSAVSALGGYAMKLQESEKERRFVSLETQAAECRADRQALRAQNYAMQTEIATLRQQLTANTADTSALRYQITRLEEKIDVISKQITTLAAQQK